MKVVINNNYNSDICYEAKGNRWHFIAMKICKVVILTVNFQSHVKKSLHMCYVKNMCLT